MIDDEDRKLLMQAEAALRSVGYADNVSPALRHRCTYLSEKIRDRLGLPYIGPVAEIAVNGT